MILIKNQLQVISINNNFKKKVYFVNFCKDGFKKNNPLYSLLPDFVGISELDYIKSKMSDVRATAVV